MAGPENNRLQVFSNKEGQASRVWLPIGPNAFKPKTVKDIIRLQAIHYSPANPKEIRIIDQQQENATTIRPDGLARLKGFIEQHDEEARRKFFDFLDRRLQDASGVEIGSTTHVAPDSDDNSGITQISIKNPDPFEKSMLIKAQAKNPNREIAVIQNPEEPVSEIETSTPYLLEQTQGKRGLQKLIRRVQKKLTTTIRIIKTK